MRMINRAKTAACAALAVLAATTLARAEPGTHGTLNWRTGMANLARVECGKDLDHFVMHGHGEGVRLRVSFLPDTPESEMLTATSVSLRFVDDHELARAHFQMFASLGGIGPVVATRDGAGGQSQLRPANGDALDVSADGLTLDFTASCTHPLR